MQVSTFSIYGVTGLTSVFDVKISSARLLSTKCPQKALRSFSEYSVKLENVLKKRYLLLEKSDKLKKFLKKR